MKRIMSHLIMLSVVCFLVISIIFKEFNLLVISTFLLNIHNMVFAFDDLENRIYFLFFNITVFLFLLSRPVIDMFGGYEWINYDENTGSFALIAIFCSLISLLIGVLINERTSKDKSYDGFAIDFYTESKFFKNMQLVALILYFICFTFEMIAGFEKILFIRGNTYLEYYIDYQSSLPVFVKGIRTMMPASLVLYLITFPSKKKAIIPLISYIVVALPNLIVGSRGAISENLIFVFLYFFLRDTLNRKITQKDGIKREKWITKRIKKGIIIAVPIILIVFSAMNYIRFDIKKENEMNPIVDFAHKQGVTFTVVTRGYKSIPYLPDVKNKNYTFGPFIDYVKRGTPAQILFGAPDLGAPNSIVRATEGNNFNAALSYYLYGKMYLQGHGAGSSYIIELYADYGYIGIIIFSVLLGMLLSSIGNRVRKDWFKNVILLRVLMDVFIIPRGSALSWLTFFIAPQFWVPVIICFVGAKILTKVG